MEPKLAALNLLQLLTKTRGKDNLVPILGFLNQLLQEYSASPPEARNWKHKDGALFAIGALAQNLSEKRAYSDQLEGFVVQHVLPEFESPNPILRARACWAMNKFAHIQFSSVEPLQAVMQAVMQSLRDPCIPVQVFASVALQYLSRIDEAAPMFLQYLPDIVDEYFRILSHSEADQVVGALQELVSR